MFEELEQQIQKLINSDSEDVRELLDLVGLDIKEDFKALNLTNHDFSNQDLEQVDFSRTSLKKAKFKNCNLRNANFVKSDLRNINLRDSVLENSNLSYSDLRGADLTRANLRNANLSYANLNYADLSGVNLEGADLTNITYQDIKHINLALIHGILNAPKEFCGWALKDGATQERTIWELNLIKNKLHQEESDRIETMYIHDMVTILPNSLLLERLLDLKLKLICKKNTYTNQQDGQDQQHAALLCITIDHIQSFYNSYGHYSGILLLESFTKRIHGCVTKSDTVIRMEYEGFLVILSDLGKEAKEDAALIASNILKAILAPITSNISLLEHPHDDYHFHGSIGIAVFPTNGTDPNEILSNAVNAHTSAQKAGGNKYQFFDSGLNLKAEGVTQLSEL